MFSIGPTGASQIASPYLNSSTLKIFIMKKFFVLILGVIFSTLSFGQVAAGVSNTEIANSIEKAKVINRGMSGIENPDSIYPGQFVWVSVPV